MRYFGSRVVRKSVPILFLAVVTFALAHGEQIPSSVAVLEFAVPTNDEQWSWARNGMADLLQIELQQSGVPTLDRDFIRLTLREQKMLADPSTTKDQFKLGLLLHAGHLITGKFIPLEGGRFRVEATAFSVEGIETIASASGEGAYPLELQAVLQIISQTLAKKLILDGVTLIQPRPSGYNPKPESLIHFYRGLNAFTRGQPEAAVAYFMNSAELDPNFAAPLLWEIKAYEVLGFDQQAEIRREEIAPILEKLGVPTGFSSSHGHDGKPVLSVLNVAVLSGNRADDVRLSAEISATLKDALLSGGKAQVFAFENIGAAMSEQDLKLSHLFARQGAPRYGRWLMADALLQCNVSKIDSDRIKVELVLIEPVRALKLAHVEQAGKFPDVKSIVTTGVERLFVVWKKAKNAPASDSFTNLPSDFFDTKGIGELRPRFQQLARALNAVRQAPRDGEKRGELAKGFVGTGRLHQAGEEINQRLDTLDIRAPNSDLTYYGIYRWISFDVGAARPWVDSRKVARLTNELLTHYPDSIAAGCLLYNLAVNEWRAGNFKQASQNAARAREVLIGLSDRGGTNQCRSLLHAAYFLEGASLFEIGSLDEAETVLLQGREFAEKFKVRAFALPLLPILRQGKGSVEIAGFGGDSPDVATRISKQLSAIAEARLAVKPIDLLREANRLFTDENNLRPPNIRRHQDWSACTRRISGLLEQVPTGNEETFNEVLALAKQSMRLVHYCKPKSRDHETIILPFARRLIDIVFRHNGISSFSQAKILSKEKILELVEQINGICQAADLSDEARNICAPLFNEAFPSEFGFSVLLKLDGASDGFSQTIRQLLVRSPEGEAAVPTNLWIKVAQRYAADGNYRASLSCFKKAVMKGMSPEDCPGLSPALVEAALEKNSIHAKDEARKLVEEFGLSTAFEPFWYDWFNSGWKHQRARHYQKAIACYENVLDFLENPEQSGVYHLENQQRSTRIGLRWGKKDDANAADLRWSDQYASRWYSAAFYLAQCLIEAGRQEEAAPILRRIAIEVGGDKVDLLEETTWFTSRYTTETLGVRAAKILKQLHVQSPVKP